MKTPQRTLRSRWIWLALAALVFSASAVSGYSASRHRASAGQEKDTSRPAGPDQATSLSDQTDLAVTVYNSNIALVRDVRQLTLPTGAFRLKFEDIAATVNPATVHFRSLTEPEKLGVLEQNYEYDLLDPAKLLHKYVGKEVTLVRSYQEARYHAKPDSRPVRGDMPDRAVPETLGQKQRRQHSQTDGDPQKKPAPVHRTLALLASS